MRIKIHITDKDLTHIMYADVTDKDIINITHEKETINCDIEYLFDLLNAYPQIGKSNK